MKKILVIGASWEQLKLIETIKKEGYFVIATDPDFSSEGLKIADRFYVKDSRDLESHLNIAQTYQIDAVISDNCDYSLYTASIVASKFNLTFPSIFSTILSNNKLLQRELNSNKDIQQPVFLKILTIEDLELIPEKIGFPCVVKPIDSRGNFGVSIASNVNELIDAYYEAIPNSPSRTLICEQFVDGKLITVDGFCFKNGHSAIAVATRKFEKGKNPVTKEIIYPGELSDEILEKLMKNHEKVVENLNYKIGHTHGEYLITETNDIFLVECTNRGGGVYTSSLILPMLTEIDLNLIYLHQVLNLDTYESKKLGVNFMKKSIMLTFLDFQEGRVIKSINLDQVLDLEYVVRFRSKYSENEMVEGIQNGSGRHSILVLEGNTSSEVRENLQSFKDNLVVEYYQS